MNNDTVLEYELFLTIHYSALSRKSWMDMS